MLKWILIVGLALLAILSFVLIQGPLSMGPSPAPSDSPAEQTEESQDSQDSQDSQESEASESGDSSESSDEGDQQSARQEPSQQARDIMQQAREAQGGLSSLQDLNGYQLRATSTAQQRGQTFSLQTETWVKLPNQFRQSTQVSIQGQTINSLTVWNGQDGWVRQQGQVQQLQGNQVGSIQQNLYLDPLHVVLFTARDDFTYAYQGTETANGTEAHVMEIQTPQDQTVTYYFDTESFLPIQRTRSAQGSTVRTVFSNYQRMNGYAFPFTQRTYLNGDLAQEQIVENVEVNPSFDPALFQKPQTDSQQSSQ